MEHLSKTDITNIDRLFTQHGLVARCKHTSDTKYVCCIKSDEEVIADVVFTIEEADGEKFVYIDMVENYHKKQHARKTKGLQEHIFMLGSHVLFKAIYKAKKLGAKYVLLMPLDKGSGKLFKFYKKLGFRCSKDEKSPTDYPFGGNPTVQEWYENCIYMIGDINVILENCCDDITFK